MLLPCRHIFYIRKVNNLPICYPEMIPERWKNKKIFGLDNQACLNSRRTIVISDLNTVNAFEIDQVPNELMKPIHLLTIS